MNITIIGASAGVGLETTRRALQQGHAVTALSRHLDAIADHPKLEKLQGSSTNAQDVKTAIYGAEAIIVTLGTGTSTKPTTLYSDSARILVQVLRESGSTASLIVLTGFGAGDSSAFNGFIAKLFFSLLLKKVYEDKTAMEQIIAAGYSRWEIVRPGRLTNAAATGNYRVLDKLEKGMSVSSIARGDVANFLIAQAERPTYLHKYIALTY